MEQITQAELRTLGGQRRCLDRGPTSLEDWAVEMGFSYGTIHWYRPRLIKHGLIGFTPGKARSLYLTTKGKNLLK